MRKGAFIPKTLESILGESYRAESGCLLHPGSKDGCGYPRIQYRGQLHRALRLVWSMANKREIPPGLIIMHSCDNPGCIEPTHLSLGTHAENHADKARKRRGPWGEKNGRHTHPENYSPLIGTDNGAAKINEEIVRAIRASSASDRMTANKFGVSATLVSKIRHREIWKHVT